MCGKKKSNRPFMCMAAPLLAASLAAFAIPAAASDRDTQIRLKMLGGIMDRILTDYVDETNEAALVEAAVEGMMQSLDSHSSFLPPEMYRDFKVHTSGEFGGLGIEVTMEEEFVKVVSPIDDTPASKAGIMAGDLITHIDTTPIEGLTLSEAVDLMRGPVGTGITLRIWRKGTNETLDFMLERDVITLAAVRFELIDTIGYIRIAQFSEQAQSGLENALAELSATAPQGGLKGIILDLRNNPGGALDQAVSVADSFMERGEIVFTRGRGRVSTMRFDARRGDLTDGLPVIVMINRGSASASEIVAGALQDHARATILGTRSFGKGSVQSVFSFGDIGSIRLTTARYYTPSGESIHGRGIRPDIEVIQELPEDFHENFAAADNEEALREYFSNSGEAEDEIEPVSPNQVYVPGERADDVQLNYALDLLNGVRRHHAFLSGDAIIADQPSTN